MKQMKPPFIASWMLEHLTAGPGNEARADERGAAAGDIRRNQISVRVRHLALHQFHHIQIVGLSRIQVDGDAVLAAEVVEGQSRILRGLGVVPDRDHAAVVAGCRRPRL
jgi:hypothetical protein